jgi:hypothetical protein
MGAWLLLAHLSALMLLPFAALPAPAAATGAILVMLSLVWHWPRHASRTAHSCVRVLTWAGDGSCRLHRQDGGERHTTLCRQAFVQPWLVILQLREAGRLRRHLVILPDMLDGVSYRQLRVRLRMELGAVDDTQ